MGIVVPSTHGLLAQPGFLGRRKKSSRQEVPAVLVPPSLGNLLHWFDFTDLSTMFTDTGGTTPVVSTGDDIARINNKGSDPTFLTEPTAADRMELDLAFHSLPSALASDAGGNVGTIGGVVAAALSTSYTFAVVFAPDNGTLAEIFFAWPAATTTAGMGMRQIATSLHQILTSDVVSPSVATYTNDVYISGIGTSRTPADTQEIFHSLDTGSKVDSQTHNTIGASEGLVIGASSFTGGFDFQGHIGEVLVWNNDQTANVPDIKAYITSKYGVSFA